jgi:hypothetical protein
LQDTKQTLTSLKNKYQKEKNKPVSSVKAGQDLHININFLYFVVEHYTTVLNVLKESLINQPIEGGYQPINDGEIGEPPGSE